MSAKHPSGNSPPIDGARFQDLQALLADPVAARRALGVRHLAVEIASSGLGADEHALLGGLLKRAANDTELVVRVALAGALRRSSCLPRDIALILADDAINVAQPILEESPALADGDLMEILKECDGRKQVCVARRHTLSADVAAAVVRSGNAAAVAALIGNRDAPLGEVLLCAIFDRYSRFETVKAAMIGRGDLPPSICERLRKVAGKRAVESAPGESEAVACANARVPVARLHADGQLTAANVLQALCRGDMRFAEDAMAEIAGVSAEKAGLLIHDASPFGLKAIYRQCAFPEPLFAAFRVAVDLVQERELEPGACDDAAFEEGVVASVLAKYRELEGGDLDYVRAKLGKQAA